MLALGHAGTSVIAILFATSVSALNYTFDASRCVSPNGYNACNNPVQAQAETCIANAGANQNQVLACAEAANQLQLNCIYENCWNIVYSCEVQQLASLSAQQFGDAGMPYYPAPDNAPGGCSCNLENVEIAVIGSQADTPCVNSGTDPNVCICCARAGVYAGIYSICPSVDPQYLFDTLPGQESLLSVLTPASGDCGTILQQNNCETISGFGGLPGSVTYLSALPATTGTASYSDRSGALSQASAPVITYTLADGVVLTATAVSGTVSGSSRASSTNAGGVIMSVGSTGATTAGVTSSTSQSTGATSSPAPKNGAVAHARPSMLIISIVILMAIVV